MNAELAAPAADDAPPHRSIEPAARAPRTSPAATRAGTKHGPKPAPQGARP